MFYTKTGYPFWLSFKIYQAGSGDTAFYNTGGNLVVYRVVAIRNKECGDAPKIIISPKIDNLFKTPHSLNLLNGPVRSGLVDKWG